MLRPILSRRWIIIGRQGPGIRISREQSDTIQYSQEAYDAASGPKELFLVKGAGHVDMYDREPYVSEAVVKLASFFAENLKA